MVGPTQPTSRRVFTAFWGCFWGMWVVVAKAEAASRLWPREPYPTDLNVLKGTVGLGTQNECLAGAWSSLALLPTCPCSWCERKGVEVLPDTDQLQKLGLWYFISVQNFNPE